jgi:hypothetical protein
MECSCGKKLEGVSMTTTHFSNRFNLPCPMSTICNSTYLLAREYDYCHCCHSTFRNFFEFGRRGILTQFVFRFLLEASKFARH